MNANTDYKNYILMCQKADKIQMHKTSHQLGDIVLHENKSKHVIDVESTEGGVEFKVGYFEDNRLITEWQSEQSHNTYWIPTQAQLQQIMIDNEKITIVNANPLTQITRLNVLIGIYKERIVEQLKTTTTFIPKTHEEWWLMLVMQWCYKKEWDDKAKEWIQSTLQAGNTTW